jgi:hypothetical protein
MIFLILFNQTTKILANQLEGGLLLKNNKVVKVESDPNKFIEWSNKTRFYKLTKIDVFIPIITNNDYSIVQAMQRMLDTVNDISNNKMVTEVILVGNSFGNPLLFPFSAQKIHRISQDITTESIQIIINELLTLENKKVKNPIVKNAIHDQNKYHIEALRKVLKNGQLVLVFGAGISMQAGLPDWNTLLLRLLSSLMNKVSREIPVVPSKTLINDFNERYRTPSLILGKYLKNNLGDDFYEEVRKALYQDPIKESETINSIINIVRPQRAGKPLDSIITFNFDDILEFYLAKQHINHQSIFCEGTKNKPDAIPIYHVHGFLPREGKLPKNVEIVFSEDAYHSQFLDPFAWSNLIQLNKFTQNTCLFLGTSLTDPNLRRLLDVAFRKYSENGLNHYMILKKPSDNGTNDHLCDLLKFLEEQDANKLGINVIWINEYSEISEVLNKINNTN